MQLPYFRCEPETLCDAAACCYTPETQPVLSLSDFVRLSEYTGEPLEDLWRSKGDITLSSFPDMPSTQFLLGTGLLHSPCPYLEDLRCNVYKTRPIACGTFPLLLLSRGTVPENLTSYTCLQNVTVSGFQQRFAKQADEIMEIESKDGIRIIWNGKPEYLRTDHIGRYFELAVEAIRMQRERDPQVQHQRTQTLLTVVQRMNTRKASGELRHGIQWFEYVAALQPVLFSIWEDVIAERLTNLDDAFLKRHSRTTSQWQELIMK